MANTDFIATLEVIFPLPRVQKFIVNKNVCIVLWSDNERTRATCASEDLFDPKIGFAVCLLKKLYNKRQRNKILKNAVVQNKI